MYLEHFGFLQQPFGTTSDPRFLYFSAEHAEALAALHYGLRQNRGLMVLTARPGMGKTTLLNYLLEQWKDRAETAFLIHPPETREQMITAVLEDLKLAFPGGYPECCRLLQAAALDCHRRGKRLLLLFDEAHRIPAAVLEEIRLLLNLETHEEKLIEMILAGQPALADRLRALEHEQLRQRVSVWARLDELDAGEVRRYVDHRLRIAGHKRGKVFTNSAFTLLAQASVGIPRNINTICFEALSLAFAEGSRRVGEKEIFYAARGLSLLSPEMQPKRLHRPSAWVTGAAAAAMVAGLLVTVASRQQRHPAGVRARPTLEWPDMPVSAAPAAAAQRSEAHPPQGPPADTPHSKPQPVSTARVKWIRVQPLENLRRIALRQYGRWNPQVWEHIQKNNPELTHPDKLRAGQLLILPAWEPAAVEGEEKN